MEEYEYISTLGEGAYGYVWKCQERSTGRMVAIKGFKQAHEEPEIMKIAVREVRVLQTLDHPAIIELIEAFKSKSGRVYMVFPYIGRSAYQELDQQPRGLPAPQLKLLVWQLLQALTYLHQRKVVHRDIKPANILLSEHGDVKLCDFGFARHTRCGPRDVQRLSSYVVTRWYRAPEVLVSDVYGPAADIWSLGCTVAELATGQPLFPGKSTCDEIWRIMRCFGSLGPSQATRMATDPRLGAVGKPGRGRTLRERLPGCDAGLLRLLEACLQVDPQRRPTAAELLQVPYFWSVPNLLVGTHLERVYQGLLVAQLQQQQQQQQGQQQQQQQDEQRQLQQQRQSQHQKQQRRHQEQQQQLLQQQQQQQPQNLLQQVPLREYQQQGQAAASHQMALERPNQGQTGPAAAVSATALAERPIATAKGVAPPMPGTPEMTAQEQRLPMPADCGASTSRDSLLPMSPSDPGSMPLTDSESLRIIMGQVGAAVEDTWQARVGTPARPAEPPPLTESEQLQPRQEALAREDNGKEQAMELCPAGISTRGSMSSVVGYQQLPEGTTESRVNVDGGGVQASATAAAISSSQCLDTINKMTEASQQAADSTAVVTANATATLPAACAQAAYTGTAAEALSEADGDGFGSSVSVMGGQRVFTFAAAAAAATTTAAAATTTAAPRAAVVLSPVSMAQLLELSDEQNPADQATSATPVGPSDPAASGATKTAPTEMHLTGAGAGGPTVWPNMASLPLSQQYLGVQAPKQQLTEQVHEADASKPTPHAMVRPSRAAAAVATCEPAGQVATGADCHEQATRLSPFHAWRNVATAAVADATRADVASAAGGSPGAAGGGETDAGAEAGGRPSTVPFGSDRELAALAAATPGARPPPTTLVSASLPSQSPPSASAEAATAAAGRTASQSGCPTGLAPWLLESAVASVDRDRLPSYLLMSTGIGSTVLSTIHSGQLAQCDTLIFDQSANTMAPPDAMARMRAGPPAPYIQRGLGGGGGAVRDSTPQGGAGSQFMGSSSYSNNILSGLSGAGTGAGAEILLLETPLNTLSPPCQDTQECRMPAGPDRVAMAPSGKRLAAAVAVATGPSAPTNYLSALITTDYDDISAAVAAASSRAMTTMATSGHGGPGSYIVPSRFRSHHFHSQTSTEMSVGFQQTQLAQSRSARFTQDGPPQQHQHPLHQQESEPPLLLQQQQQQLQQQESEPPLLLQQQQLKQQLQQQKQQPMRQASMVPGGSRSTSRVVSAAWAQEATSGAAPPRRHGSSHTGDQIAGKFSSTGTDGGSNAASRLESSTAGACTSWTGAIAMPYSAGGGSGSVAAAAALALDLPPGEEWVSVPDTGPRLGAREGGVGARSGGLLAASSKVAPAPLARSYSNSRSRSRFFSPSGAAIRSSSNGGALEGSVSVANRTTADGHSWGKGQPQQPALWAVASSSLRRVPLSPEQSNAAVAAIGDPANESPSAMAMMGSSYSRRWNREDAEACESDDDVASGGRGRKAKTSDSKAKEKGKGALSKIIRVFKRAFSTFELDRR